MSSPGARLASVVPPASSASPALSPRVARVSIVAVSAAGASGDAISFACESYAITLPEIEAYIGHRIPVGQLDPGLLVEVKVPPREGRPRFRQGGGGRAPPRWQPNRYRPTSRPRWP